MIIHKGMCPVKKGLRTIVRASQRDEFSRISFDSLREDTIDWPAHSFIYLHTIPWVFAAKNASTGLVLTFFRTLSSLFICWTMSKLAPALGRITTSIFTRKTVLLRFNKHEACVLKFQLEKIFHLVNTQKVWSIRRIPLRRAINDGWEGVCLICFAFLTARAVCRAPASSDMLSITMFAGRRDVKNGKDATRDPPRNMLHFIKQLWTPNKTISVSSIKNRAGTLFYSCWCWVWRQGSSLFWRKRQISS